MYFIDHNLRIPDVDLDILTNISAIIICEEVSGGKIWTYHFLNISQKIMLKCKHHELKNEFHPRPLVFDNCNVVTPIITRVFKGNTQPEFYYKGKKCTIRTDDYLTYISPKLLIGKSVCFIRKFENKSYLFESGLENKMTILNTGASITYNVKNVDEGEYLVVNYRILAKNIQKNKQVGVRLLLYMIYFYTPVKELRKIMLKVNLDQLIYKMFDDVDNTPYIDINKARDTCFKEELE